MSENLKTEKQAVDLRAEARALAEAHTRSALVLAEKLFEIKYAVVKLGGKEIPLVEFWKFRESDTHTAFGEYVEHDLGLHESTAENYVHVHDVLILGEGLKPEQLPSGITKLIQLSRIAKKLPAGQTLKSWLKKGQDFSCCEFHHAVEEAVTGKSTHIAWSFYLSNKDQKDIKRGLARAKEILKTKHNGETLAMIVDEWCELAQSNRMRLIRKAG